MGLAGFLLTDGGAMTEPINPRIDERGVGICQRECPHYRRTDIESEWCELTDCVTRDGTVCLPWARLAAKDHQAMEAVRTLEFIALEQQGNIHSGVSYRVWLDSPLCVTADDPADAILNAATAAKERR